MWRLHRVGIRIKKIYVELLAQLRAGNINSVHQALDGLIKEYNSKIIMAQLCQFSRDTLTHMHNQIKEDLDELPWDERQQQMQGMIAPYLDLNNLIVGYQRMQATMIQRPALT